MADQSEVYQQVLIAVVQNQDSDLVELVLEQAGHNYNKLPSAGAFLRERSVTFLIKCNDSNRQEIIKILASAAKKRVSYVATPLDNSPFPIVSPSETLIGGVSLFTLDIEHFEEM